LFDVRGLRELLSLPIAIIRDLVRSISGDGVERCVARGTAAKAITAHVHDVAATLERARCSDVGVCVAILALVDPLRQEFRCGIRASDNR
jgi:hypothetical protein